jgi:hypothetical protein
VSSDARTQPTPRARAVAGAPVDALLGRADELARRWAIALILARPLERIGEFPLERFAREAPRLCAQVVRALRSDAELELITAGANGGGEPSPASRLAEVTGTRGGTAAVEAVEALRGVLWEALLDELRLRGFDHASAREVAELADRLAYVCSSALVSSLTPPATSAEQAAPLPEKPPAREPPEPVPADREPAVTRAERSLLGDGVVIVDEGQAPARRSLARAGRTPERPAAERAVGSASHPGARRTRARPLPWDTPLRADSPEPREEPR